MRCALCCCAHRILGRSSFRRRIFFMAEEMVPRRTTHVLRHVKPTPAVNEAEGEFQRHPKEKQVFQVYEEVANEDTELGDIPLEVILTGFLEEFGNRGDVVNLEREFAREMILVKKAVYASPENLTLFQEEMNDRAEELKKMPRMSPFALKSARLLNKTVFPVSMNMDLEWTIQPWHMRVALRNSEFVVPESSIILPEPSLSGPDLTLENVLFRFYVVMNRQIVVPALGRIQHVIQDESRQVVSTVSEPEKTTWEEMKENGLAHEDVYIHDSFLDHSDIWVLMQKKISQKDTAK